MAALVLLAARVGGVVLVAPVFSARTVPVTVRTGLTILLTLLLHAAARSAAGPRSITPAAVIGEAMAAYVLADALLEKLGGDSLDEIRPRLAGLRQARLADLEMDNVPWRFE